MFCVRVSRDQMARMGVSTNDMYSYFNLYEDRTTGIQVIGEMVSSFGTDSIVSFDRDALISHRDYLSTKITVLDTLIELVSNVEDQTD